MPPSKTKKINELIQTTKVTAGVKSQSLRPASIRRRPQKLSPPVLPKKRRPPQKLMKKPHPAGPSTRVKNPKTVDEDFPIDDEDPGSDVGQAETGDEHSDAGDEASEPDESYLQEDEPMGEIQYLQPGDIPRPLVKKPRSRPPAPVVPAVSQPPAPVDVSHPPAASHPPAPIDANHSPAASQQPAPIDVRPPSAASNPLPSRNHSQSSNATGSSAHNLPPPPPLSVAAMPPSAQAPSRNASQSINATGSSAHNLPPPPPLSAAVMPPSQATSEQMLDADIYEENPPAEFEVVRSIRCKRSPNQDGDPKLKRRRGPVNGTRLDQYARALKGKKITVDVALNGKAPKDKTVRSLLVHEIGSCVREMMPMDAPSFSSLPGKPWKIVFRHLSTKFELKDKWLRRYVMDKIPSKFRAWKHECRQEYREGGAEPIPVEFTNRPDQWRWLVEHFQQPDQEVKCTNMQGVRLHDRINHCSGKVPFSERAEEHLQKGSKANWIDTLGQVYGADPRGSAYVVKFS